LLKLLCENAPKPDRNDIKQNRNFFMISNF
jgi:hypothetical protein